MVTTQLQKEAGALKERLSSLEAEFAQLSANQQAATDNLEQMAKSADVCDRYKNHLRSFCSVSKSSVQTCFIVLLWCSLAHISCPVYFSSAVL